MAFRVAQIEIAPAAIGTGVKATLRKGKSSPAKLTLLVSAAFAQRADWRGGDRLEVLLGDGEHHGLLRLRKNNSVGKAEVRERKTAKAAFLVVALGHQAAFVNRTEGARWCQWERVEDGWLEVVLPKWADETGPRSPPAPAPRVPAAPVRRGQDVTASLMGDPAPGRREAMERVK